MTPKMTLSGDLASRLQALPASVAQPILLKALKVGAEPIRSRMAALAPRSSPDAGKPGHMADHIVISSTRKAEGRALGEDEAAVAIGPSKDFFWAGVHEFGPHDGRYSAHPFARPAFDSGVEVALRIVMDELWNGLRRAAESGIAPSFGSSGTSGAGLL